MLHGLRCADSPPLEVVAAGRAGGGVHGARDVAEPRRHDAQRRRRAARAHEERVGLAVRAGAATVVRPLPLPLPLAADPSVAVGISHGVGGVRQVLEWESRREASCDSRKHTFLIRSRCMSAPCPKSRGEPNSARRSGRGRPPRLFEHILVHTWGQEWRRVTGMQSAHLLWSVTG